MNENRPNPSQATSALSAEERQRLFDRLVDGELDGNERRALLTRLDGEPDGWRRCALAFLEAQSFAEGLRAAARDAELAESTATVTLASAAGSGGGRQKQKYGSFRLVLAMAASFFLAFALGISLRGIGPGGRNTLADREVGSGAIAQRNPAAAEIGERIDLQADRPLEPSPETQLADAADAESNFADASRVGSDLADAIWLPANTAEDEVLWGGQNPSAVPENVIRDLRRQGHRVEQQRELWPVSLEDGSRALMPVDRVRVHYVGHQFE